MYFNPNHPNSVAARRVAQAAAAVMDDHTVRQDVTYLVRNGIEPNEAVQRVIAHRRRTKIWALTSSTWILIWWAVLGGALYFPLHAVIIALGEIYGAQWPEVEYNNLITWKDHYASGGVPGWNIVGLHEGSIFSALVHGAAGLVLMVLAVLVFRHLIMYPVKSWRQAAKGCYWEDSGKLPVPWRRPKSGPGEGVVLPGPRRTRAWLVAVPYFPFFVFMFFLPFTVLLRIVPEIQALITAIGA